MIPRDFKVELLGIIDIVNVIDQYVPLKKSGTNYVSCCPFHHEKTPSFTVSKEKQFYHCFGCQVHGDAISFIMNYVGLDFVGAIEKLASFAGLPVPSKVSNFDFQQRASSKSKKDLLKTYYHKISEYFIAKNNTRSTNYLKSRGICAEIIKKYSIGYAPQNNYTQEIFPNTSLYPQLVMGGLLSEKNQQYFPMFRDRIIFPIRNIEGDTVAFGGRIIDKGKPKYLNSPDTILFNKSECLYGLFEAKNWIRRVEKVLVVEGYMDVISMAQCGIDYAVATLGTATTGGHILLLFRFSNCVYFCFDGDVAGKKAATRALTNSLKYLRDDKIVYFIFLPEGEDPDSYVRQYGKEEFESFVESSAIPLSQYFILHLVAEKNLNYSEVKAEIIQLARPLLLELKAHSLKFMLMQDLADRLKIDVGELGQLVNKEHKIRYSKSYRRGVFSDPPTPKIEVTPYNRKMLYWLLINPKLASYVELPDYLEYSEEIQCLLVLADIIKINTYIKNAVQLKELCQQTKFAILITDILMESFKKDSQAVQFLDLEENFKHGIKKIKKAIIELEVLELKDLINQRSLNVDEDQLLTYLLMR